MEEWNRNDWQGRGRDNLKSKYETSFYVLILLSLFSLITIVASLF